MKNLFKALFSLVGPAVQFVAAFIAICHMLPVWTQHMAPNPGSMLTDASFKVTLHLGLKETNSKYDVIQLPVTGWL